MNVSDNTCLRGRHGSSGHAGDGSGSRPSPGLAGSQGLPPQKADQLSSWTPGSRGVTGDGAIVGEITSAQYRSLSPLDRVVYTHDGTQRVGLVVGRVNGQVRLRGHKLNAQGWLAKTHLVRRVDIQAVTRKSGERNNHWTELEQVFI